VPDLDKSALSLASRVPARAAGKSKPWKTGAHEPFPRIAASHRQIPFGWDSGRQVPADRATGKVIIRLEKYREDP